MRILFTSLAAYGHAYPLIPLAIAAQRAGHEVRFATGAEFHPVLDAHGLRPEPAGHTTIRDAFAQAADPTVGHPRELPEDQLMALIGRVFGDVLPRSFLADLPPLIDSFRPDLMINELGNRGGSIAALQAGVPELQHGFGRIRGDRFPGAGPLIELCAELDLPADRLATAPIVDICPESLQDKDFLNSDRPRIALRPVPVAEPGDPVDYTTGTDRPLVYLTLGTAMGSVPVLRAAIDGLATLDVDVLAATGPSVDAAALGGVPDSVRVLPWVRQPDLLGHLALAVHHGGSGTTLGALGAGVPQLFLPQGADQFDNADAVIAAGAGRQLTEAEVTADNVAAQAKALLAEPSYRDAAAAFADEIAAMPGPDEVAAALPAYLG